LRRASRSISSGINWPSSLASRYFIIYDANGGSLGRIEGAKLREDIVIAYFQAKIPIDAINHNNLQYQEWTRLQMGAGPELAEARQMAHQLISWADTVVRRQKEKVREILPGLIADIEEYQNGSDRRPTARSR
jgi:hypothetical protein